MRNLLTRAFFVFWLTLAVLILIGWGVTQTSQGPGRHWHRVAVTQFNAFTQSVGAAYVCTSGTVLREPTKEADGDYHIRLGPNVPRSVKQPFVVLEIIPELPLPLPKLGMVIEACGVIRYDQKHGWWELHPLLRWEKGDHA